LQHFVRRLHVQKVLPSCRQSESASGSWAASPCLRVSPTTAVVEAAADETLLTRAGEEMVVFSPKTEAFAAASELEGAGGAWPVFDAAEVQLPPALRPAGAVGRGRDRRKSLDYAVLTGVGAGVGIETMETEAPSGPPSGSRVSPPTRLAGAGAGGRRQTIDVARLGALADERIRTRGGEELVVFSPREATEEATAAWEHADASSSSSGCAHHSFISPIPAQPVRFFLESGQEGEESQRSPPAVLGVRTTYRSAMLCRGRLPPHAHAWPMYNAGEVQLPPALRPRAPAPAVPAPRGRDRDRRKSLDYLRVDPAMAGLGLGGGPSAGASEAAAAPRDARDRRRASVAQLVAGPATAASVPPPLCSELRSVYFANENSYFLFCAPSVFGIFDLAAQGSTQTRTVSSRAYRAHL
jgi:hypothetical protein